MQEEIFNFIKENGQVSPKEIKKVINLGDPMIFRHLKKLTEKGLIQKIGKSPKVYYFVKKDLEISSGLNIQKNKIIEENFSYITSTGNEILGEEGFFLWCKDRQMDINKMQEKYIETFNEYQRFIKDNYIDATVKIKNSFKTEEIFLDKLVYFYFYSYPIFGRCKVANWLFYGKTLQQKHLIKKVINEVQTKIYKFILENRIEAIAYIPPTVPRKIQFMKELEEALNLNLPKIKISKIATEIIIQQKSLKEIKDRIQNAENTMIVEGRNLHFNKILLIDDFTGSGATLNVLARKCKEQNVATEVIALTITGSVNGFEVIKEV